MSRSSVEAELHAAALWVCEGLWLRICLEELDMLVEGPIHQVCDNNATIAIIQNPVHHDCIKHVEVDRHFIKEKSSLES